MNDPKPKKPPIPPWGWVFALLCVAIPILTLGGAIPGAIGGGGAFACAEVSRDDTNTVGQRVSVCLAITVGCWAIFLLFLGGVQVFTGSA